MLQWLMNKIVDGYGDPETDPLLPTKQIMREAADLIDFQQEEIERLKQMNRALYNYLNEVREHGEVWGD